MNEIIKSKMQTKNKLYQQYIQNGRFEYDLVFIESLIAELNDLIFYMKDWYYENLAKNWIIHCYKLKHIGQSLDHFITTEMFP